MTSYVVLVENDESQWDDRTGESYHFPNRYRQLIPPGTKAIYYKGKIKDRKYSGWRLSDDPHYFGLVVVGEHYPDIRSDKGDWYAKVDHYKPFVSPVAIRQETEVTTRTFHSVARGIIGETVFEQSALKRMSAL